jgi:hypothetical protein
MIGWAIATAARKGRATLVWNNNGIIKVYTVFGPVTNCPPAKRGLLPIPVLGIG